VSRQLLLVCHRIFCTISIVFDKSLR